MKILITNIPGFKDIKGFKGFALYSNPNKNPNLAIQSGPQGWLILTRKRQWMSPKLRRHENGS